MKPHEKIDCVELKNSIQRQLLKEAEGLTDQEEGKQFLKKMGSSDSPVAKLWKYLQERQALKKAS